MKISQRLYLTILPSAVAVLLLAGLLYWGQYAREAPQLVLLCAALAVLAWCALAWSTSRSIALRIERLAARATAPGSAEVHSAGGEAAPVTQTGALSLVPDEIDEIERVVYRLSSAVEIAEMNRADREALFERRAHDYALLLVNTADACLKRIEDVRLPLHILLENRFGELNENQEEMLGAARAAAEAAEADFRLLRQIATFDLGDHPMRRDRVKPAEMVDALRPLLVAAATASGGSVEFDVAPLLPAVLGDRALLHDSLTSLLRDTIACAPPGSKMQLTAGRDGDSIDLAVQGGGDAPLTVRWAAAARVIQAHGGSVTREAHGVRVALPTASTR